MANKLLVVCFFILTVELAERLCFYTIIGTSRTFLSPWFGSAQASSLTSANAMLAFALSVLGGWVADAKLGRYWTILLFLGFYCMGDILVTVAAYPSISNIVLYFIGAFAFIGLGQGGLKPNVSSFGADQYNVTVEAEAEQQKKFFSYFLVVIEIGSLLAFGYFVTLATGGQPPAIPRSYGYFTAYAIVSMCMVLATIIFYSGTPKYQFKPPGGDVISGAGFYLWKAAKTSGRAVLALVGWGSTLLFLVVSFTAAFAPNPISQYLSYTSLALLLLGVASLTYAHLNQNFIDKLPDQPGIPLTVQEASDFFAAVPVLLISSLFYMPVSDLSQMWMIQACQMNLRVDGYQFNGGFFQIACSLAVIIFAPFFELFLFPFIEARRKSPITRNQKIITGYIISMLGMVSAIAIEFARKTSPILDVTNQQNISLCAGNPRTRPVYMSSMSSMYMFIPFGLQGIANVFVIPAVMYFAYNQTPPRARSVAQAFNNVAMGALSQGITAAVTQAFAPFLGEQDNLNMGGQIEIFYYFAIALLLAGIPLVLFVSSFYKQKVFEIEGKEAQTEAGKLQPLEWSLPKVLE